MSLARSSLVEKYGTDAVRYILLRHVSPTEDADLTLDAIHEHYTAHLTNVGNLVARIMQLAESNLDSYSGINPRTDLIALERFDFHKALDGIWARIQKLDQTITETKPFAVIKEDSDKGKRMIDELRTELLFIAHTLAPYMPATSRKIHDAIVSNKKPENLFPRFYECEICRCSLPHTIRAVCRGRHRTD